MFNEHLLHASLVLELGYTGMLTLSAPPECKGIWILSHEQEEKKEKDQELEEEGVVKLQ